LDGSVRILLVAALVLCTGSKAAVADDAPRSESLDDTREATHIRAHLLAARRFVRGRDVSKLDDPTRQRRERALATLDRYITRGEFSRRTDDPYLGRRPRFVDDRGVHCAVGYLIAESGAPELARAINAEYEYAYVPDIASPALLTWAVEHGFTVEELARIQPAYVGPPTPDGFQREVEHARDNILLACAARSTPLTRVELAIDADDQGRVVARSTSSEPFARCVAEQASRLERGGGAYLPSPRAFVHSFVLALPSLQQLLETRMRDQVRLRRDCTPRPGAVPTHATIDVASGAAGERALAVRVKTSPQNNEVAACLERDLATRLHAFAGVGGLAWNERVALTRMTSRAVHDGVRRHAPGITTDCYGVAETMPKRLTVSVRARRDAPTFTITTNAHDKRVTACITGKLEPKLRADFTVSRARPDGTSAPYFRIDAAVTADVSFTVESPAERDARLERARKTAQERRRALERELEHRPYDVP
jgi:hypothetical protein